MGSRHGLRNHPFYPKWQKARHRCMSDSDKDYHLYKGRGITMQTSWLNDPIDFISYLEKLPNYFDGASIDRIDNDKGYMEGNLRWADQKLQGTNQKIRSTNTSGYAGVFFRKDTRMWFSRVTHDNKAVYLGQYKEAWEALYYRNAYIAKNNLPHKIQV